MREIEGFSILEESDGIEALDSAWDGPETFIFLPERSGIKDDWLFTQLREVPSHYRRERFCLLTSGSTGEPKLVFGVRQRTENLARTLHLAQNSEHVRTTVLTLPLTYSFAFVNQWVWARVHNRRLGLTNGLSDARKLAKVLDETQDSMICLVGAQIPLLSRTLGESSFEGVIRVHFAGGPFPESELPTIHKMFPRAEIYNNYGCAEAMPRLTLRKAEISDVPNDVGPPLEGVRLRITDTGDIEFQSEYRVDAQISESQFEPINDEEWFPSGDKGEIAGNGHLILHGRSNAVFKRYGEKISLMQLSKRVGEVWGSPAMFYNETDGSGEPGHVLVLSPIPEREEVLEILRVLRNNFPRAHWPLRIEALDEVPLLPNGKEDIALISNNPSKIVLWTQRI